MVIESMILFVVKICHFALRKKKRPKQHGHENFWKNFQKSHHISMKTIMKLPRFFKGLGIFLAFFF
jgi:hypothetical protein